MNKIHTNRWLILSIIIIAYNLTIPPLANACTRFVYKGNNNLVITARNQDWKEDIDSKFWKFPRGMKRSGVAGDNPITWTSKYGSVIISGYDMGTAEGVNEKGLAVHLLWLAGSDYGHRKNAKTISFGAWSQYVLDNFATTNEAVKGLTTAQLQIIAPKLPTGHIPMVHISITDKEGDSAIVEYIDGKQVIHHSSDYTVMTNEPSFEEQLSIQKYWQVLADYDRLPGSSLPIDRFTRANYYLKKVPKTSDAQEALAIARSILETVTVPRGYSLADRPNISTTVYRSLFDHKNMKYYYQGTYTPHFFWVDLKKFDFGAGTKILMLDTKKGKRTLAGEVSKLFVESEPFKFISD
jgi:choloylglycine hydrolase